MLTYFMDEMELLQRAFVDRSLYILGAGVSAGIIPVTSEQSKIILNKYINHGIYSVEESTLDEVSRRLLGNPKLEILSLEDELIRTIPSGTVHAIGMQSLTINPINASPAISYKVFNLFNPRSILLNFNTDGLANFFCKNKVIINAHGTLPAEILHSDTWNQIISYSIECNINLPNISSALLPQREPITITQQRQYKVAKRYMKYTTYTVIIGYSFGYNGHDFDDAESLCFLSNLLKIKSHPILIVDPFKSDLIAEMLKDAIKTHNVFQIKAYWDKLAQAIYDFRRIKSHFPHDKCKSKLNLTYLYNSLLDRKA